MSPVPRGTVRSWPRLARPGLGGRRWRGRDVHRAGLAGGGAGVPRPLRAGELDLRRFPLDGPLPDLPPSNAAKARQKMMIALARRENLSIREPGRRFTFSLGHLVYVGTAMGLADLMEE